MGKLKNMIKAGNEKDWEEEVYTKGTLKWSRLANDDTGVERFEAAVQAGTGSAGLLEDKKRCGMVSEERCVICDSRVWEDVVNFLVGCAVPY